MDKNAYLKLLTPIVADYRSRDYAFWFPYIAGDVILLDACAADGTQCCVEINAMWDDKPEGNIRVIVSIDNGGWRALVPVTESFVIARDGTFVGE